jgi:hypothetical protein
VKCARQEKSSPGFFMDLFAWLYVPLSDPRLSPGHAPPSSQRPGLFHSVRDGIPINPMHPAVCEQTERCPVQFGETMTKAQLELLARMIRDGQAVIVERGGKLIPVSRI